MPNGKQRYPGLWARRRGTVWLAPQWRRRLWPRSNRKRIVCALLILACAGIWPALGMARTYKVQKGDVLSSIAQRFLHGHVWGPHGTLQVLWNLNPFIKNPDYILPGEIIHLPDELCLHAEPVACPAQKPCPKCQKCPKCKEQTPCPAVAEGQTPTEGPIPSEAPVPSQAPVFEEAPAPGPTPAACPACAACPAPPEATPCNCNNRLPDVVNPEPFVNNAPDDRPGDKPVENPNLQVAPATNPNAPTPAMVLGHKTRHLELHVSPYYRFTQLNAEVYADRSNASLDTRINAGVFAGLSVDLVSRLTLMVDVQAGTLYFASPSTVRLTTGAVFEYSAAVTLQFEVVPRLSLVGGFTYGNEPFSTADATLVLDIQMISMPGAMAGLSLTALCFTNQNFGIDVSVAYKFNVHTEQFQVRNGNVFFAGVFWHWLHDKRPRWRARVGFEQRRQDTSLISQTDNTVGLDASYVWPVD